MSNADESQGKSSHSMLKNIEWDACDEEKKYKLRSPGIVSLWMNKYLGVYF